MSDEEPTLLSDYISRSDSNPGFFTAVQDFNDDEFSDNDLDLLKLIANFVKSKIAKSLVDHTHSQNSLWRKSAIRNGILELLETERLNSTEYKIDFSLLFENNPVLLERFEEIMENLEFSNHLKG